MRRLAKPVSSYRGSEGSNPSLSASSGRRNMAVDLTVLARVASAVAAIALAGCAAKRELVIVSDPPGALVRLDDEVVGLTPYQERFLAYGTRRVTLYRDGYRTSSRQVRLDPPWYARFPIDVFSEVLFPIGWQDRHVVRAVLEPESGDVPLPDFERVLARAESLRLAGPEGPRPLPQEAPAESPTPAEPPVEDDAPPDPRPPERASAPREDAPR